MPSRVVTVSQTTGAAPAGFTRTLARRLGYRHADEEIVMEVARRQGLDPAVVADVERRRSFFEAFWEALDTGEAPEVAAVAVGGGYLRPESLGPRTDYAPLLRELIREVVVATADRGEVVINAHAASYACAGRTDVLRVLVTASAETRARRVAEERAAGEREGKAEIERSDAGRGDYLKRFYGVDRELPTHYDLVVNTDRLAPEQAVELVAAAAA